MSKPTVKRLVALLEDTSVHLVERARPNGEPAAGYFDGDITLALSWARARSKADTLVQVLIHELIHAHDKRASEETTLRWEMELFKSRTLREACCVKLLNCFLFGEE